jgi:hypothetical protein
MVSNEKQYMVSNEKQYIGSTSEGQYKGIYEMCVCLASEALVTVRYAIY